MLVVGAGGDMAFTTHVACSANVRLVGCDSACTGKSFVVTLYVSTSLHYPLAHYGSTGRQSRTSFSARYYLSS